MPAGTQSVETEATKAPDLTTAPAKNGAGESKDLPVSPELSGAAPAEVAAALSSRSGPAVVQGVAGVQAAYGNGYAGEVVSRLREARGRERIDTAEPAGKSPAVPSPSAPVTTKPAPKPPAVTPPALPVAAPAPVKAEPPKPAPPQPQAPKLAAAPAAAGPVASAATPAAPATPEAAIAAAAPVPPKPAAASPLESRGKEPGAPAKDAAAPAGKEGAAPAGKEAAVPAGKGPAAQAKAPAKAGEEAAPAAAPGEKAAPKKKEGEGAPPGKGGEPGAAGAKESKEPAPGKKSPSSPQEDPAFLAVAGRARAVAHQQGHNNPAQKKAMEAQAAAPGPENEVASQAAAAQVGKMAAQKPNPFDKASFKAALMERVKAITPKNLEEADDFKKSGKAASIKGDVTAQVASGKETAQGGIETTTKEVPDPSVAHPKEVTPLPPTDPGPAPPEVGAQAAAPKPKTEDEVSLQQGSQELDSAAGASDPPLDRELAAKSNEPEFQSAVDAKEQAQQDAAQRPAEFRDQEGAVLAGAQQQAVGSAAQKTAAMHNVRADQFNAIVGDQQNTQTEDQKRRADVSAHINDIYTAAKQKVEDRLKQLDTDVNKAFDTGAEQARAQFETYVDDRMRAYKDDRYSGVIGKGAWVKDKLLGMPDEVNVFYTEGRNLYISLMDGVIDNVAGIVETGLTEAMQIIEQGRNEVKTYVEGLPKDLQDVGQQAATAIQQKFDKLAQSVQDKQSQLIDSLAQKYADNLKAIDARIGEMKAANRGLVDAALDAVKGVIKTILQMKDMLLSVLARAASIIGKILSDPIGFLGNLVAAVRLGLDNFIANIGTHLMKGLMAWIFGALASAGIQLPDSFDLKGILSLILQILGLTYANIRARAVAIVGEPVVKGLETAAEIFKVLITEGPAGLWNYIKDQISNLKDVVLDGIKSFIMERVIIAGITWIVGLLNPAAAFIKACKAIYDIVMFIVNRGAQILAFVNSVLDSMEAIASGAIGGAAAAVENALASSIPVLIGMLASLLGIGDPGAKVREILAKVRDPINAAIDWVINKAVALVKSVGGLFGGKKKDEKQPETDDPEHDAKVSAAVGDIGREEQKYLTEGKITRDKAAKVATTVKGGHPILKTLEVVDAGERWDYAYTASAGATVTGEKKADADATLPYKIGDKVFIVMMGEEELGIMDQIDEAQKPPLVFFKIQSGPQKGSRYGVPKEKVQKKAGIRDYVGHDSKFVLGNKLDDQWSSNVRGKFYPSGYRVKAERWLEQRLTQLANPSNPKQFKDEISGQWAPAEEATIDHVVSVVTHWNSGAAGFGPGSDATQKARADFYNTTSNMQAASRSSNAAKGGGGSYTPKVGPNFRGPGE